MSLILGMYRNQDEMYPYEDPDVVLERVRKLKNNAIRDGEAFYGDGCGEDDEGDKKKNTKNAKKSKNGKGKSGASDDDDIVGDDVEFPDDSDGEREEDYNDVEFPDDEDEDEDDMDAKSDAEGLTKPKKKNNNKKAENLFDDAIAPKGSVSLPPSDGEEEEDEDDDAGAPLDIEQAEQAKKDKEEPLRRRKLELKN